MFFTREDINKIYQALPKLGIKDSELPRTSDVKNDDTLAIVQDGENKQINVREFLNQISLWKREDFINVTDKYKKSHITLVEAIQAIPIVQRKEGLVITFLDTENNWRIYQFRGSLLQFNNETLWVDLYDFSPYIIDSILPDEEDITQSAIDEQGNTYLSLKDREYNPSEFSGKGYKILRKNIIEIEDENSNKVKKNILTEEMISEPNTVYEIRYDFDLNGEEITIQNNCVLKFEGGALKNGTIHFENTSINANSTDIIFKNVEITGTIIEKERYAHWFEYNANHDDWNLISTLFNSPGNVYLESRIYNVDKTKHTLKTIEPSSNLNVYGCEGCELDANYTSLQSIDSLFLLNEKANIKFDNIRINCTIGTVVPPPAGHGSEKYPSSGLYIFFITNYCTGITLKNVIINNAAYAIKTSKSSSYDKDSVFENIVIEHCKFVCDMPVQGTDYSNLICRDSEFLSRGTNSGNHALYILPVIHGDYVKSILFENCHIGSFPGDGHTIQIYSAFDTDNNIVSTTSFVNCLIENDTGGIVASTSARVVLDNCTIKSEKISRCSNSGGLIEAYSCNIFNIEVYQNWRFYNCIINNTNAMFITGERTTTSKYPIVVQDCIINTDNYIIYNCLDGEIPIIRNCTIICGDKADGIISVRDNQKEGIKFINCNISVPKRLTYSPGKQEEFIISFIDCILHSGNVEYALDTSSEYVKLNIINCVLNDDIINIPIHPQYVGTSLKRPINKGTGQIFFDTTLDKPIWWTGTKWVNSDGMKIDLSTKGNSDNRPVLASNDAGYQYYDTTLKKYIVWNGTEWTNMDGTTL